MAQPFLKSVADYIYQNYKDNVEKLCLVLPNKRGALFLKKHLAQTFGKTIWLPAIISAEELIEELSGLKTIEEIDLLCHLYESYKVCCGADAETFESFAKWGQIILHDFNEIDRYLVDAKQLYSNLKDIKEIENWSLGAESLSNYQSNYLRFMQSLSVIYEHFSQYLCANGWAHQGLSYKTAVAKFSTNTYTDRFYKIIFCGFNALNAAELKIFNALFTQKKADLLWDADKYYLNDTNQEAGFFLRNNFQLFQTSKRLFVEDNFHTAKEINIIAVPKQIGQAQVVKQTIQKLIDDNIPLDRVAVVLANEKLLWPVLQQLPSAVTHVNITMEYPLKYTSTFSFLDTLLLLQINYSKQKRSHKTIYHKDLIALLRQPLFESFAKSKGLDVNVQSVISQISKRNLSFISADTLQNLFGDSYTVLRQLLQPTPSVSQLCQNFLDVIQSTISFFADLSSTNNSTLELEYLRIILKTFNRLTDLLLKYTQFNDLQAFKQLFLQVVGNASAPFIGEPLQGLQIMGVLETRTLDFDHVILVNVNEGVLPSGKSVNSFIPNDLKRAFGLPLYAEKDAIYAYHFYRLLQRASEITITYDSQTDTFGKGEKSRFLTQLQLEMKQFNASINIHESVASYNDFQETLNNVVVIHKDKAVLDTILEKVTSQDPFGALSPSSLITYKDCPLQFYFRYGARLKEIKEVEESAEANTFGSILHLSLENLYKPFIGKVLHAQELKEQLHNIENIVHQSFISFFDQVKPLGKSLLQQEVICVYVKKLLKNDIKFINTQLEQQNFLTLNHLEKEFTTSLDINIEGKFTTIYIKGKIDRIDSIGGISRIIDYKSSVKGDEEFKFSGFEKLFHDKKFNKQLQLMIYAWLLYKNGINAAEKIQPCIFPFKNFSEEPRYILNDKSPFVFTKEFLDTFELELKRFIESIFDHSMAFEQTNDEDSHIYCPYNTICNFAV